MSNYSLNAGRVGSPGAYVRNDKSLAAPIFSGVLSDSKNSLITFLKRINESYSKQES